MITLKDAFKTRTFDQDKTIRPEETIQNFKAALKKADLDILKETRRIDNGRLGIPVFLSVCGKDARALSGTRKQMGKGADPLQAEASAMMELAERFSFFSLQNDPSRFFMGSLNDLGKEALPFEMIARSVHDDSKSLGAVREIFAGIPMKWTKGWSLNRQKEWMIPFDWFFAINEFNGTSAGNGPEEALTQGICETIERHVSFLVSEKIAPAPKIRPDSASDPAVKEMIEKYRAAGVRIYISDFSCGLGIPTVGVLAHDPSTFPEKSEIVWTAGTAPNPEKALARALTETAQLAGDFNTGANYLESGLPKFDGPGEADFVIHPEKTVGVGDLPDISDPNMRIEVENLVGAVEKMGMEALIIETTHPLLKIPAFYTIVPGTHFRERAKGGGVAMFLSKIISETLPPGRAIDILGRMDQALPGKYFVRFQLASAHLSAGRPDQALRSLKKSLDMDPAPQDIPSIYSYMGVCLKDMGEYQKALSALEKGARHDPKRTDIHNLAGFCHFMLKEHEKAIASFKKVLEIDPGSAIDYANIASNYRDMGKKDEAVRYYALALELDPSIDFARQNLEKLAG
ncbi:conserved hypothetical protein [Candidatus Desulfarcum epimagneticum]|uniref:YcaO domain-containing protein n=1 Tax=uncultured Desulfobacteraceae bacterium TaxID=218296 RepID=A0A484HHA9_9BACT|nr:conserved hypothetical protein [uncultured Desulfobacteraceae bacterium]